MENRSLESLGEPLFNSRSSQIYNWEEGMLLKLFHDDIEAELIKHEHINTMEAFEKGISAVECCGMVRVENRTGMLIKRIEGKTLIALAGSKPTIVFRTPGIMADLQAKMHAAHTQKIRSYKELTLRALDSPPLDFLTAEEKELAKKKVKALPDGDSILHLDYHPDNIMSDGKRETIIDWMTAARGAPAADVAATLFLLNEGEMIPSLSKAVAKAMEMIRRIICKKYYKKYKQMTGLTDDEVSQWRLPFLVVRLHIWNIDSEVPGLQRKIREELTH